MRKIIRISILETHGGSLFIAGNIPDYDASKERLCAVSSTGERLDISPVRTPAVDTPEKEDKKATSGYYYELSLPLRTGTDYRFICSEGDKDRILTPKFGKFSRILSFDGAGFMSNGYIIKSEGSSIRISGSGLLGRASLDRHMKSILKQEAPAEIIELRSRAAAVRKSSRPIWLISDRSDSAGDNGEALFEYLMKDRDGSGARDRYDIRFLISPKSPDYERMKELGPVVAAGSDEHRILFLASSLMISSAADNWVRNPLGSDLRYCRDIIDNRFVFLQHGVIKDDLSSWLHKLRKNLQIFITTAPDEYASICDGRYGYGGDVVKLTGLARYDRLRNDPKKVIAILPTWRKYAAPPLVPGTSERLYSEDFKDTEYCRFYNALISDPELTAAMKEYGYTGTFYLHPSHMNQWKDFEGNDVIDIWHGIVPFSRIFSECSLLITDYSSVAIDFAYLGKPVLYTQFDRETFFSTHTYTEGYYDYERDGFGPVCHDHASAVKGIIEIIKNDCKEPAVYQERVDRFFAYRDRDNCRRIYEELLKL